MQGKSVALVGRRIIKKKTPTRPAWHGPPDALRTVWTQPRATVRWILDHGDLRLSILLVAGAAAVAVVADGSFTDPLPAYGRWTFAVTLALGARTPTGEPETRPLEFSLRVDDGSWTAWSTRP